MEPSHLVALPSFTFGPWRADPATNCLTCDARSIRVEPRIMALLCLLASEPGTVWGRATLTARLWPDTHVGEDALTRAVSDLRKVLGDEPRKPTYIATIPKRGYQFLGEVVYLDEPSPMPLGGQSAPTDEQEPIALAENAEAPAVPSSPQPERTIVSEGRRPNVSRRSFGIGLLLLMLPFIGWLFHLTSTPTPPPAISGFARPAKDIFLTNYPGRERRPAISPDGSRVAFTRKSDGRYHIFMIDANGDGERALTHAAADHDFPAWSPDGTRLAFCRDREEGSQLISASALGGDETVLYSGQAMDGLDFGGDGRRLYFSERAPNGGPFRIQVLNLKDQSVSEITPAPPQGRGDILPRVSPDGSRLAFMRVLASGAWQLILLETDGDLEHQIIRRDLHVAGFDWVDDRYVVISNLREGTYGLWLVDTTNGHETWLPTRGERSYAPTYSAMSQALVYEKVTFEKNIWVLDTADPRDSHRALIDSNYYDCEAVFSPDGNRILFTSSRSGSLELWLAEENGGDLRQLTELHGAHMTRPRWAPDGRSAAVSALKDGEMQVFLIEPEQGRVRDAGVQGMLCDWSHSGRAFYVAGLEEGRSQLYRWDLESRQAQPFLPGDVFFGRESVDGRWFYFTYRNQNGLWRKPLHEAGEAQLIVPELSAWHGDNWDITGQRLFYVASQDDQSIAVSTDLEGGDHRDLGPLPRIASPSLSVSQDGTRLLYGRVMRYEVDLILTKKPWNRF